METPLQSHYRQHRYAVLPQILQAGEIDCLRAALLRHFATSGRPVGLGLHQPNAAVAIPELAWLYAHPGILAALRDLSGGRQPVFTGNSDAHKDMLSWWHKDTSEGSGGCFRGDWTAWPDCSVIRVGVYLQDHPTRDGLSVRLGSQHHRALDQGAVRHVSTSRGDIVLFDVRLTHAGQFADGLEAPLLKAAGRSWLTKPATRLRTAYSHLRRRVEKLSIFFTYGSDAADTQEYCDFELAARHRRASPAGPLPDALLEALLRENVAVPRG
ncbi:MAG: hypothetical protein H7345_18295 [Rubritepida sp.]|nr:hypothetical protein [Rubritepida sp.]